MRVTWATPGMNRQRPGYRVIDEPGDRLVTSVRRGHCVSQDCPARSLDAGHHRVTQAGRKIRADLRYSVAYLGDRAVDVLAEDEFHNRRGGAVQHRGGDVPDVAETGDRILDAAGDQSLDLGRSGAGLRDGNHDRGQIEIGRVVDPQRREGNIPASVSSRNSMQAGMGFRIAHAEMLWYSPPARLRWVCIACPRPADQ